jgi:hypothetical protein
MHVKLTDERIISVPLKWIASLYHAQPTEREKYKINRAKSMLVWDPSECEINEEIRMEDYLGSTKVETKEAIKVISEKKSTYQTSKKKK